MLALGAGVLTGCGAALAGDAGAPPGTDPDDSAGVQDGAGPPRIVSLDYCADQYVLALADRDHVLALSPDADRDFSYLRQQARGLPQVAPRAEAVLALRPTVVVRSYGGGPRMGALLDRAGVERVEIPWSPDLAGAVEALRTVAAALGASERGEALARRTEARLAALAPERELLPGRPRALYMTAGGVTTGPGTLVHEMLRSAGVGNFQEASGWRPLPLERLARDQPDLVVAAFLDAPDHSVYRWSAMRHPVARRQLETRPVVSIDGAWTACGAWFLIDAIEEIAAAVP
jgi:iron complex transport system substrate-binding protein